MRDLEAYVYESPDGGDTIYRRRVGDPQREQVSTGPVQKRLLRSQTWRNILRAAESDPVLADMLDRVEVYHALKDSPQDR